jgi:hypothetical protein
MASHGPAMDRPIARSCWASASMEIEATPPASASARAVATAVRLASNGAPSAIPQEQLPGSWPISDHAGKDPLGLGGGDGGGGTRVPAVDHDPRAGEAVDDIAGRARRGDRQGRAANQHRAAGLPAAAAARIAVVEQAVHREPARLDDTDQRPPDEAIGTGNVLRDHERLRGRQRVADASARCVRGGVAREDPARSCAHVA